MDICPVCNVSLASIKQDLNYHINQCLDKASNKSLLSKRATSNSMLSSASGISQKQITSFWSLGTRLHNQETENSSGKYSFCPLCSKNITRMSQTLREKHFEKCLLSFNNSKTDLPDSSNFLDSKLANLHSCIVCKLSWVFILRGIDHNETANTLEKMHGLKNKSSHLVECAKASRIEIRDLLRLVYAGDIGFNDRDNESFPADEEQLPNSGTSGPGERCDFLKIKNSEAQNILDISSKDQDSSLSRSEILFSENSKYSQSSTDLVVLESTGSSMPIVGHKRKPIGRSLSSGDACLIQFGHTSSENKSVRSYNVSPGSKINVKPKDSEKHFNHLYIAQGAKNTKKTDLDDFVKDSTRPKKFYNQPKKTLSKNETKLSQTQQSYLDDFDQDYQTGLALSASLSFESCNGIINRNSYPSSNFSSKNPSSCTNGVPDILGSLPKAKGKTRTLKLASQSQLQSKSLISQPSQTSAENKPTRRKSSTNSLAARTNVLCTVDAKNYLAQRAIALQDIDYENGNEALKHKQDSEMATPFDTSSNNLVFEGTEKVDHYLTLEHSNLFETQNAKNSISNALMNVSKNSGEAEPLYEITDNQTKDTNAELNGERKNIPNLSLWGLSTGNISPDNQVYITQVFELLKCPKKQASELLKKTTFNSLYSIFTFIFICNIVPFFA